MDEVVELVVVIPTSQDHRKWSLDAKVTTVFVLMFSSGPEIPPRGQNFWGGGGISIISAPAKFR
jgi:hypothetical protein